MTFFIRNLPWRGWYVDIFDTTNENWRNTLLPYMREDGRFYADNPSYFSSPEDAKKAITQMVSTDNVVVLDIQHSQPKVA